MTAVTVVEKLDNSIYQTPVVKTLDSAIHWVRMYPRIEQLVFLILIRWIGIYPVDSAKQSLNDRGQINSDSC